jgi:signal transduction histidine kinase
MGALHLVGNASARATAAEAAGTEAQLGGSVRRSRDVHAALNSEPADGLEVVILLEPREADIGAMLAAVDRRGLPRWAVVPATLEEAASADFARDRWGIRMLAQSIRSAVAMLALRRENARLRGDLGTIGRRLTHDLRTPLNSISTANEALAEPSMAADSASSLHQSIAAAVLEAGNLIERIGTVLLASARPIERQPVVMDEVVWNALQTVDRQVRESGATIVPCEQWPAVLGAAPLLEIVWTNLLLNSLEHGGPAPRIEMGWDQVETHTRFWVRDGGAGVDPARRARLFHPLDRLNELNAPRGYGLSLVQRLVELQSGTTGYHEQPGPGGTFFFTLPRDP